MVDFEKETLDRLRRIETRLSRYMADNGFDLQGEKPQLDPELKVLTVPSRKVSLTDCLTELAGEPPGTTVLVVMGDGEPLVGLVVR